MSGIRVFVSFDVEHDRDLYERFIAQSSTMGLGITVSGASGTFSAAPDWSAATRREIQDAQRILVICGEHTEASLGVFSELRIAQEERKPHFLLWGRRDRMCTKPVGARSETGMYGWTMSILHEQFAQMGRDAEREAMAKEMKRSVRTPVEAALPAA